MIVVEIIDAFYATNIVHGLLFSGLKIVVTRLSYPRQYKVNDVTAESASQLT